MKEKVVFRKDANLNELMVTLGTGGYLYFKTEADTLIDAKLDFYGAMENAGINCDNLVIESFELRDPWGDEIVEEE